MRQLLLLVCLMSPCAADYFLQRSWPNSSSCSTSTPSFSYVSLGPGDLTGTDSAGNPTAYTYGQCVNASYTDPNTGIFLVNSIYACANATHFLVSGWSNFTNCTGPQSPGYPIYSSISGATGGCLTAPGGNGSAMAMCVPSALPYAPPASEPFTNSLFNASNSSAVCGGQAQYAASLSAALSNGCSLIAQPSGPLNAISWASIALSLASCQSSGAAGSVSWSTYSSTNCSGPATSNLTNGTYGVCAQVGNVNVQLNGPPCSQPSAAADGLSGGAIAGIIIASLVVVGGVAAAAVMGGCSGGSRRPKTLLGGGETVMRPVMVAKPGAV